MKYIERLRAFPDNVDTVMAALVAAIHVLLAAG
jgi:hypothetical protein